jgi:hypothetical protein
MPREGQDEFGGVRSTAGCVELGAPSRGPFFRYRPTMRWKVTSIPAVAPQMNRPCHGIAQ